MEEGEKNQNSKNNLLYRSGKNIVIVILITVILLITSGGFIIIRNRENKSSDYTNIENRIEQNEEESDTIETNNTETEHSTIDLTKLPLGDDMYSTSPKKGYVYSCQTSYNGGGAFEQGPWIDAASGTWDLTKKVSVDGSISWPNAFWNLMTTGTTRSIESADLPFGHNTGVFPISSSDEAYNYDRNPNSIEEQTISLEIPKNPTLLSQPECIGGEVGIATTGVLIFNAFDAGGRDAVATEIQDECEGHPQAGSYYHYHGYSSCFNDESAAGEHSDLLGYAFDGFGIYGLKGEDGIELSSSDLDECHGHTHEIEWDGKTVSMYHYHFTNDFPYTVSCFRGEPSIKSLSSGEMNLTPGMPPRR